MRQAILVAAVLVASGCSVTSTPRAADARQPTSSSGSTPTGTADACTRSQLHVRFFYGGMSAGNDLGGLRIRNHSAQPCSLTGAVSVQAFDRQHHPLSLPLWHSHAYVAATLQPDSAKPYLVVWLAGEYRDDPRSGRLCSQRHEVAPAYWRLTTAAGRWTSVNQDPESPNGGDPGAGTGPGGEA